VNAAVLPYVHIRIQAPEFSFGFVTGLKTMDVHIVTGSDFHPLNVMLLLHGMGDCSDFDEDAVLGLFNNGHMLLASRISGLLCLQDSWFTTATRDPADAG
jgi:hypothetical protein